MADYSGAYGYVDNIQRFTSEDKGKTWRWTDKVDPFNGAWGSGDIQMARDEALAREIMALTKVVEGLVDAVHVNKAEEPTITEPPAIVAPDARGVGLEHLVDHLRGRVAELETECEMLQEERDEARADFESLRDAIRSARDELDGF